MAERDKPSEVELRGTVPRTQADVLDAVSAHRRISRWDLCAEIIEGWCNDKMAEVISVVRVTGVTRDSGFGDLR